MDRAAAKPPSPRHGMRRDPADTGWQVQLVRGEKPLRKSFADAKYGGREVALQAAREWRDYVYARIEPTFPKRTRMRRQGMQANNVTGTAGVSLRRDKHGSPAYYVAQTQLRGGPHYIKLFAITRGSDREALDLAIAERERQLKQADAYRAEHPRPERAPPPGIANDPEMYGITRIGSNRQPAWGWQVKLTRAGKQIFEKHFGDAGHGGEAAALEAARAWRDEIVRQHPPLLKRDYAQQLRKNNTSGVAGVHRCIGKDGHYTHYAARTTLPNGRRIQKTFWIAHHGEEQAFELAVAERQRQLEAVEGYLVHSPSALPPVDKSSNKKAK